MTGFFGVGGGFVVDPGLVLALGFGMAEAVGTSLLVIALNSVVALAAGGGVTAVDWNVVTPFTAAAMAGSVVGAASPAGCRPPRWSEPSPACSRRFGLDGGREHPRSGLNADTDSRSKVTWTNALGPLLTIARPARPQPRLTRSRSKLAVAAGDGARTRQRQPWEGDG